MYQLVYASTTSNSLGKNDILNIVTRARDFNATQNITGCLVYHKKEFIHLLEGDREAVRKLYTRIEKDDRHLNVTMLFDDHVDQSVFTDPQMHYYEITDTEMNAIGLVLFKDHLKSISQLSQKPTLSINLFWNMVKSLLSK